MPQRRHLSNDVHLRAIGMLKTGMKQVQVARRLGVSQSVISCLPNARSMKCYSHLFYLHFNIITSCCRMTTQDPIGR